MPDASAALLSQSRLPVEEGADAPPAQSDAPPARCREALGDAIERAAEELPTQGPITVFVHHNTLHALEGLPFDQAVLEAGRKYGCEPYLSEQRYREELRRGRIRLADLEAVLAADLADDAGRLVACFGTRYLLRLAMLRYPLDRVPDAELRWLIAETDAMDRFRSDLDEQTRREMRASTRRWLERNRPQAWNRTQTREFVGDAPALSGLNHALDSLRGCFGDLAHCDRWSPAKWESFVVRFLWHVCQQGVRAADLPVEPASAPVRHRDLLYGATGQDCDRLVDEVLTRFAAAFLDQGFATWTLPEREEGFLTAFARLYCQHGAPLPSWLKGLPAELRDLLEERPTPLESIARSLDALGVTAHEQDEFLSETLLALRGWAGMLRQVERDAAWLPRPAPRGTLHEYLAVRLILQRHAIAHVASHQLGIRDPRRARDEARRRIESAPGMSLEGRAFHVFQLAQLRGWTPAQLIHLSRHQWRRLLEEIEAFSSLQRRRIFHLAYERQHRHRTLDAVSHHVRRRRASLAEPPPELPSFQMLCCLDEREESLRRHLEEIEPRCETFGIAGFFGVAMYYRGAGEAHYRPLCPASITPRHYVREEPAYSLAQQSERQTLQRATLGRAVHRFHVGTRSLFGGALAGLLGSLAAFPLVTRILFPRATAGWRRSLGSIVQPAVTELRLERLATEPGPEGDGLGYSVAEMVDIVAGALRSIGLTDRFARLVIVTGHGSASLNNPHEAAHDCGACGGGRGGPNARAFAQMANDPRVRRRLAERGLAIAEDVVFVGAYHNTCDDRMTWYDLDRVPVSHRRDLEAAREAIQTACQRDAHERVRRFDSAALSLSPEAAVRHVQGRAEDLSQTRPEYGHATNALCFVGRRQWSRGLFLDRRAFLTSYDPHQDDADHSVLEGLLQAVLPVCAGINLEYYFSYVDPVGYGCGTKLPHNITSLLGVMDGAQSDLRTGLPWQMVEIHEPVRLLCVIETTPVAMLRMIDQNPPIRRLVDGGWIQLVVLDAELGAIHWFDDGTFKHYQPESAELPEVDSSLTWYRGNRHHLGFASIRPSVEAAGDRNGRGAA